MPVVLSACRQRKIAGILGFSLKQSGYNRVTFVLKSGCFLVKSLRKNYRFCLRENVSNWFCAQWTNSFRQIVLRFD